VVDFTNTFMLFFCVEWDNKIFLAKVREFFSRDHMIFLDHALRYSMWHGYVSHHGSAEIEANEINPFVVLNMKLLNNGGDDIHLVEN
jgi:hypothetical protein